MPTESERAMAICEGLAVMGYQSFVNAFPRTDGTIAFGVWCDGDFEREGIESLLSLADKVTGTRISFHGTKTHPRPGVVYFTFPPEATNAD